MINLQLREKIIIGIMGIAILYAAVDFLIPAKKHSLLTGEQNKEELESLVATLASIAEKGGEKAVIRQIAEIKQKPWRSDPFLDEKSYSRWLSAKEPAVPEKEKPAAVFVYSGYLDAGQKRLAVINGFEYQAGDVLEINGGKTDLDVYKLKSVSPESVVILNTKTGKTTNFPLAEVIQHNVDNKAGPDGKH
jgi:hypothetical protein